MDPKTVFIGSNWQKIVASQEDAIKKAVAEQAAQKRDKVLAEMYLKYDLLNAQKLALERAGNHDAAAEVAKQVAEAKLDIDYLTGDYWLPQPRGRKQKSCADMGLCVCGNCWV